MTFSHDSLVAMIRQDIVMAEQVIDMMINALRAYPGAMSKESRVAAAAKFLVDRIDPEAATLILSVAIERIAALEHFESDVPRTQAGPS